MQRFILLAGAYLCCCCGTLAANVHPVDRAISLLQQLREKVKSEGQAEEVTYSKFEAWCASSIKTLDKAIADGKKAIDALESKVEAKTGEEDTLTKEISFLEEEIGKYQARDIAAKTARDDAAALYQTADADLESTIQAISEAITELESAQTSTGGSSLIQAKLKELAQLPLFLEQLTVEQRGAFFGSGPNSSVREDILAKGDYDAHKKKYTFKSGNVIELLKELRRNFEDDRIEGTKAETNAQNAYELALDARAKAVQAAEAAKSTKTDLLGDVRTDLAEAKNSLKSAKDDLKADSTTLSSTKQSCAMKKSEWEERSEVREHEMKALAAGIEILSKVAGVRTEAPSNPVPPPSPTLLLLQNQDPRARAVNLLREEARRVHSRAFARFAEEVAARLGGPFDEVNNMIQKMIFRLMAEQKDEDDHKNWCDMELSKSNISKVDKEGKIASLDAKLADAKATIQQLAGEITNADDMVAKITAHMEKATEIRQVGKAENKAAVKDAKDAQAAIAEAEAVLIEFYKNSGMVAKEPWEFLQRGVDLPNEPSTWSASYTGVSDPTKQQPDGIITVLKAISADFAKMESGTLAQEATDQTAYEEEMKNSEILKAKRAKESEVKGQEKKRLEEKVNSLEKSSKHVAAELGAVEQYLKDLAPACLEGDSTYEDRKAARNKEIDALKEAQVILADWQKENATELMQLRAIRPVSFLARQL